MIDLVVRNGKVIDGTGKPARPADVGIHNGKIIEPGWDEELTARVEIDAAGQTVVPGFIDVHSHGDLAISTDDPGKVLQPLLMQGITTFVGGNCGFSGCTVQGKNRDKVMAHLQTLSGQELDERISWQNPDEFFREAEQRGIPCNMATLAGHGTLRIAASGLVTRLLTADEQRSMEKLLDECMEMGCLGLSTGLQYYPGSQSDTDELVALGGVLKKYNGIFTSHLRSYAHTLDLALDEVFRVGRENGIPVQVSHLYWQPYIRGLANVTRLFLNGVSFLYNNLGIPVPMEKGLKAKLKLFEKELEKGTDVHFDMVPTSQGFTELFAFLPPYASEGSSDEALERLKDPAFRKRMLHDIEKVEPDWPHRDGATWSFNYIKMTGWKGLRVMAVESEKNRWMEGLTFPDIGKELDASPMDVICDLLIEEKGRVMVFHTPTFPDDPLVFRSMWEGFTHPLSVPVTDTILRPFGRPSHVFYDCFPRFLSFFAGGRSMLSMEEAVHKCTGLPASIMGLQNRGLIREGYYADIVVVDEKSLGTDAGFDNPRVYPRGIAHVLVNGVPVVENGNYVNGALPGKALRRRDG
jgi:N-acyl-D-amino-acid deacylase